MTKSSHGASGLRQHPGTISTHELYSLAEAKARLGWTDSAMRAARRRGLSLLQSGKRRYVTGSEIIRFLHSQNAPSA